MARTPGATGTVLVKLSDLKRIFSDEALIPVSRKFCGLNNIYSTSAPSVSINSQESLESFESISIKEITE